MDLHDWPSRIRVLSIPVAILLLVAGLAVLACWLGVWVLIAQRL
jgi:hypothetical protein